MNIKDSSVSPTLLGDPALLETIDQLFACNVGQYISLPQLVVVGDQSSGKSSVLEGLTKLSFPRDSGLCTRFATQIVFRRQAKLRDREITASIIPGNDVSPEDKHKLESWKSSDIQSLDNEGFTKMMEDVHMTMDLSNVTGDGKATFSSSILKLEICGPDENHLSVIDVPGIFRTPTPGRTTIEDRDLVRNMVLQYMNNPRSIMLTVVPANVDIATQEIIHLAREIDPQEERTLKILTKPDLVDKGAEGKVIDMIEEGNRNGQLGWIVVRNAGQKELDEKGFDRDHAERAFFQSPPWNNLPRDNCGVKSLMQRLQELLAVVVTREYPKVEREISRALEEARKDLHALGSERNTAVQQRTLLLDIMSEFKTIVMHAIATNYGVHEVFDKKEHVRLATIVSNRNATFSEDVATMGHTYSFQSESLDPSDPSADYPFQGADQTKYKTRTTLKKKAKVAPQLEAGKRKVDSVEASPSKQNSTSTRPKSDLDDVDSILPPDLDVSYPVDSGIIPWIKSLYRDARGFEIGTFNHLLLSTLMKKQSAKWPALAQDYISDIITVVHRFIITILEDVCRDKKISSGIISILRDDLFKAYRKAMSATEFLLQIEREGTPMTLNHYLNDNLQKCRQKRVKAAVKDKKINDFTHGEVIRIEDLIFYSNQSNSDHTVQDIHDILESYYKVARKRFVDNICMQAADHCLVTGSEAPMKLFSPSWVNGLSDNQLQKLAGEDNSTKRRRQKLQKEIGDLEAGRKCLAF